MMNKVSIVSVSYNAERTIEKTIISVLEQTYAPYQYIFIDGKSTDLTFDIIEKYRDVIEEKGIEMITVSEPDTGIYDAMNKAIEYCSGDWVIYMNATDAFFCENVLRDVFLNRDYSGYDCIYGTSINVYEGEEYFKKNYPIYDILYRAAFVHQSFFIRTGVLKDYPFELRYSISADYNQFIQLYLNGINFKRINTIIAKYYLDGISSSNSPEIKKQWNEIWKNNGIKNRCRIRRFFYHVIIANIKKNGAIRKIYIRQCAKRDVR